MLCSSLMYCDRQIIIKRTESDVFYMPIFIFTTYAVILKYQYKIFPVIIIQGVVFVEKNQARVQAEHLVHENIFKLKKIRFKNTMN